jgi:hypothetical protein
MDQWFMPSVAGCSRSVVGIDLVTLTIPLLLKKTIFKFIQYSTSERDATHCTFQTIGKAKIFFYSWRVKKGLPIYLKVSILRPTACKAVVYGGIDSCVPIYSLNNITFACTHTTYWNKKEGTPRNTMFPQNWKFEIYLAKIFVATFKIISMLLLLSNLYWDQVTWTTSGSGSNWYPSGASSGI